MEWAVIWSWVLAALRWCFYAVVLYIAVRWWARSMANGAKMRFIEAKIDALLDHFDVGFEEGFREHIAGVLREKGQYAARSEYILRTGNDAGEVDQFLQDLSDADKEAEPAQVGPPHGPVTADELHELVDQVFQQPPRKPRRKRR